MKILKRTIALSLVFIMILGIIGGAMPVKVMANTVKTFSITGVTISPTEATVGTGETQQFTATVQGTGDYDKTVTWSVEGGVEGTTIDNSGKLTVASDERATTLTVKATASGDDTKSATATVKTFSLTGVTISPTEATVENGETQQFTATVAGIGDYDNTVTWSVSGNNNDKTTIDSNGNLRVGLGETATTLTVKATANGDDTKSATATVKTFSITGVTISPTEATVEKGGNQQFTATVAGTGGYDNTVTWSVEGGVAGTTIDSDGNLRVAPDETATTLTVKATANGDNTKSATATVKTFSLTGVTIFPTEATVEKGGNQQFTATVAGIGDYDNTVTWSVSGNNNDKTTIDSNGNLRVGLGETATTLTVKATANGDDTKSATATVKTFSITGVTISPTEATVEKGETQQFTATVQGTGDYDNKVNWSVNGLSAETTIDSSGKLTVASDEAATTLTVKATANGDDAKSATATVTVVPSRKNTEIFNISVDVKAPSTLWERVTLTPQYNKATRNYILNLESNYDSIHFYLETLIKGQGVTGTVNGVSLSLKDVEHGFETDPQALVAGENKFVFTVTALDEVTKGNYTIVVNPDPIKSIEVNSSTHKTAYKVGDELDVTNLTIKVTKEDNTTETVNVTADMVTGFDSSAVVEEQTLTITYMGKTTTYKISVGKADGPEAPTGLVGIKPTTSGGSDGKITGTSTLMEYSQSADFVDAKNCTGSEILNLTAGTYYVRVKETATHKAGQASTVIVPPGEDTPIEKVTVSFDANGGTGTMASVEVDKGSNYKLPSNEFTPPADKEFKSWSVGGSEKQPGESITVSEDTEVKAIWRDKGSVEKVTVSFNANGGTGTMASVEVDKGSNYNLPANGFTPPADKEFKAWDIDGTEKSPGESIKVDADTEVKAIWKNKAQEKPIVDKTDLQDAIDNAQAEIDNTKVSTDGKDVPKSDDWVNKEDKDELQKAIDNAKTIMGKAKATQSEINSALKDLKDAIRTFKAKKAKGQLSKRYPDYSLDPSFILWGPGYYTPSKPEIKPTMRPVARPISDEKINLQARLVIGSKTLEKTLNGAKSNVEMDIAPYIIDGRTMVPIRFVAEALGFKVDWDGDTWTVILKDKYTTIEIPVNTNKIIVNGNVYESDVSPILENGRTFLPIGNVARALGLKDGTGVIWNENTKEVIIKREIIVNL